MTRLLASSQDSWLSSDLDITPRITEQGLTGFYPEGELGSQDLAIMIEGRFESLFAGETSPLLREVESEGDIVEDDTEEDVSDGDSLGVVSSVIERSPESARLILIASNSFLADQILRLIGSAEGIIYNNTPQLLANIVDWTAEDRSLLAIRSRGHFNRTLPPLAESEQRAVEILNYAFALIGIGAVFLIHRRRLSRMRGRYQNWMAGGAA